MTRGVQSTYKGEKQSKKSAFPDRPQTPWGKKKGKKGPCGATHGKNGIDGLEATKISVVLPVGVFRIDS